MPGRMPGPGAYKLLEWGPEEDRRSCVLDHGGRMLFPGNPVRSCEHNRDGRVIRLVDEDSIEVLWRHARTSITLASDGVFRTDRKIR